MTDMREELEALAKEYESIGMQYFYEIDATKVSYELRAILVKYPEPVGEPTCAHEWHSHPGQDYGICVKCGQDMAVNAVEPRRK